MTGKIRLTFAAFRWPTFQETIWRRTKPDRCKAERPTSFPIQGLLDPSRLLRGEARAFPKGEDRMRRRDAPRLQRRLLQFRYIRMLQGFACFQSLLPRQSATITRTMKTRRTKPDALTWWISASMFIETTGVEFAEIAHQVVSSFRVLVAPCSE